MQQYNYSHKGHAAKNNCFRGFFTFTEQRNRQETFRFTQCHDQSNGQNFTPPVFPPPVPSETFILNSFQAWAPSLEKIHAYFLWLSFRFDLHLYLNETMPRNLCNSFMFLCNEWTKGVPSKSLMIKNMTCKRILTPQFILIFYRFYIYSQRYSIYSSKLKQGPVTTYIETDFDEPPFFFLLKL